jgi:putative transposase
MSDNLCLKKHHRRSIRLKGYDYAQVGGYFLTMIARDRTCLFGEVVAGTMVLSDLGKSVQRCWDAIPAHFSNAQLDTFMVMPNHIHGIIVIVGARHASPLPKGISPRGPEPQSIGAIVGSFKSAVTKFINNQRGTPGTSVWQRNYYEHIIRDESTLERIREYIVTNPLRWAIDRENPSVAATHASPASPKDDPWRV